MRIRRPQFTASQAADLRSNRSIELAATGPLTATARQAEAPGILRECYRRAGRASVGIMLGLGEYEEILARLETASSAELAQVVSTYRGYRRGQDGNRTEITIELLRGAAGFTVTARTADGRSAEPGQPTWDLAAAIDATDWSGVEASGT